MIEFEWTDDTVEGKRVYFVGTTRATKQDRKHESEIMEQLDAQWVGWA